MGVYLVDLRLLSVAEPVPPKTRTWGSTWWVRPSWRLDLEGVGGMVLNHGAPKLDTFHRLNWELNRAVGVVVPMSYSLHCFQGVNSS